MEKVNGVLKRLYNLRKRKVSEKNDATKNQKENKKSSRFESMCRLSISKLSCSSCRLHSSKQSLIESNNQLADSRDLYVVCPENVTPDPNIPVTFDVNVTQHNAPDDCTTKTECTNQKIVLRTCSKLDGLNEDCLRIICAKLELRDQINFARTCVHFYYIFEDICYRRYKRFDCDNLQYMTYEEKCVFFGIIGKQLKSIHSVDRTILPFLRYYCPEVRSVRISHETLDMQYINDMINSVGHIYHLRFDYCWINDDVMKSLAQFRYLQSLSVNRNYLISGKYISRLWSLKKLSLFRTKVKLRSLCDIGKSLIYLTSLNIMECDGVSTLALKLFSKHCVQLEVIKISIQSASIEYDYMTLPRFLRHVEILVMVNNATQFFKRLVQLKFDKIEHLHIFYGRHLSTDMIIPYVGCLINLKQLTWYDDSDLDDSHLIPLHKLEQLEYLVLQRNSSITNEGLLNLIRACTKLKRLDLQHCMGITNEFVYNVNEFLRKFSQSTPRYPLVIKAAESGIVKQALTLPLLSNVKLDFSDAECLIDRIGEDSSSEEEYN